MKGKTLIAFLVVVALQVLALAGMVVYKETTLRTGQEVVLQTLPVDPRDPFRGDYLVLRYVISSLNTRVLFPFVGTFEAGTTVYVRLEKHGDVFDAVAVARRAPDPEADLVVIRGTVVNTQDGGRLLQVEYGIESYFVPEGQGLVLQRAQDIKAVVVVDGEGRAILKRLIVDGQVFQTR